MPELAGLSDADLHTPWLASPWVLAEAGVSLGEHYPWPLRDLAEASRQARDTLHQRKALPDVRKESSSVYARHGSRNPNREGRPRGRRRALIDAQANDSGARPPESPQLSLLD